MQRCCSFSVRDRRRAGSARRAADAPAAILTLSSQVRNIARCGALDRANHVRRHLMIWTIAVILFVLWLLGFVAFHIGGGLIHLLLVLAVIAVIYQLVTGRRAV
jgi:hypothetical protein